MDERVPELRERLRVITRHKLLVFGVMSAAVAGGVAYALARAPEYSASATIVVRSGLSAASVPLTGGSTLQEELTGLQVGVDTEAEIATSISTAKRVAEESGLPYGPLFLADSVEPEVLTEDLFRITAVASTPNETALIANAFAEQYLANRHDLFTEAVANMRGDLDARIQALEDRARELNRQIARRTQAVLGLPDAESAVPTQVPRSAALLRQLRSERNQVVFQLTALQVQAAELAANPPAGGRAGEVVEPAVPPEGPDSPGPVRAGAVGLLLGGILGIGLAFLREHMDRRIRTRDEAAAAARAPVLASMPRKAVRKRRRRWGSKLIVLAEPGSVAAKAYRTLRANLAAMGLGGEPRSLLVTPMRDDPIGAETVANLSALFARAGLRTVAVSADLQRPRVQELFRYELPWLDEGAGVVSVLSGRTSVVAATARTEIRNLAVLPAGRAAGGVTGLLDGADLDRLLATLREIADVVLIEAPPMSSEAEVVSLAKLSDSVLAVVRAGSDTRDAVSMASVVLDRAHAPIGGVFLVDVDPRDRSSGTPITLPDSAPMRTGTNGNGGPTGDRDVDLSDIFSTSPDQ